MSCDNVNIGNGQLITIGGNNVDAFGRLRVSNPLTIFDSKSIMSQNSLFNSTTASGGSATTFGTKARSSTMPRATLAFTFESRGSGASSSARSTRRRAAL